MIKKPQVSGQVPTSLCQTVVTQKELGAEMKAVSRRVKSVDNGRGADTE